MSLRAVGLSVALLPFLSSPAFAQLSANVGVEVATDERRRGLSWSADRAVISADTSTEIAGVRASARVATTRGSARHGGADAVADLAIAARRSLGLVELEAQGRVHLFSGASGQLDYVEVGVAGYYTLGPVIVDVGVDLAPDQQAIGGSNLYISAGAAVGIPGTPLTLSGAVGRSTGNTDNLVRAVRLRPEDRYHDWRLGVEHVMGPLTFGFDYTGTDISVDAPHAGDRLLARARLSF